MSKIDEYIIKSFTNVIKIDSDLIKNINERTFVFRMGHYLVNYIEGDTDYKVDVEYNRRDYNIKKLDDKNIMPDLIIHKRNKKDNLAIIEFKKNENSEEDKSRLIKMKNDKRYLYKNIYFILINKNKIEKYIGESWTNILGDSYE